MKCPSCGLDVNTLEHRIHRFEEGLIHRRGLKGGIIYNAIDSVFMQIYSKRNGLVTHTVDVTNRTFNEVKVMVRESNLRIFEAGKYIRYQPETKMFYHDPRPGR